jgi:hypothetical protein
VRLATSIRLARHRAVSGRSAAEFLVAGYLEGLQAPQPALLDEGEIWLRPYVIGSEIESGKFWTKLDDKQKYRSIGSANGKPPRGVMQLLNASLPRGATDIRYRWRFAGGGSLGRPRYVAIAHWCGGRVLREAKALVPSAWSYVHHDDQPSGLLRLATGKYRAPDPMLKVEGKWIIRRIAPDSRKIELDGNASGNLKSSYLRAMGFELASIHAGSADTGAVRRDLQRRPPHWLYHAAKTAKAAVEKDFAAWKRHKPAG